MQGFAGSYTHVPNDTFVFKGGVTWTHECFEMLIGANGSNAQLRDVYTVDSTWFNGGSYVNPKFDMEYEHITGSLSPVRIYQKNNIKFHGIEITRQILHGTGNVAYMYGGIRMEACTTVTISNCNVNAWKVEDTLTLQDHDYGGICSIGKYTTIEYCTVTGVPAMQSDTCYSGVGIRNGDTIRYCTINNVPNGILGGKIIYNCDIGNIRYSYDNKDNPITVGTRHTNGVYLYGGNTYTVKFFNNYVHDIIAVGSPCVFPAPAWGGENGIILLYNNYVKGGSIHINGDYSAAGNTSKIFILNNLIYYANKCVESSWKTANPIDSIIIKNNILVTTGTFQRHLNLSHPYNHLIVDNNVYTSVNNSLNLCLGEPCIFRDPDGAAYNINRTRELFANDTHSLSQVRAGLTLDSVTANCYFPDSAFSYSNWFNFDKNNTVRTGLWDIGPIECYNGFMGHMRAKVRR